MVGRLRYKFSSYGLDAFYNTRFELVHKSLNKENADKFFNLSRNKKVAFVNSLVMKGKLI